jgi:hypothetical protein
VQRADRDQTSHDGHDMGSKHRRFLPLREQHPVWRDSCFTVCVTSVWISALDGSSSSGSRACRSAAGGRAAAAGPVVKRQVTNAAASGRRLCPVRQARPTAGRGEPTPALTGLQAICDPARNVKLTTIRGRLYAMTVMSAKCTESSAHRDGRHVLACHSRYEG